MTYWDKSHLGGTIENLLILFGLDSSRSVQVAACSGIPYRCMRHLVLWVCQWTPKLFSPLHLSPMTNPAAVYTGTWNQSHVEEACVSIFNSALSLSGINIYIHLRKHKQKCWSLYLCQVLLWGSPPAYNYAASNRKKICAPVPGCDGQDPTCQSMALAEF